MPALDVRTVMLGYVLTNLVCLAAIAGLWLQRRSLSTDLNYWLADFVMQAAGILLLAFRDRIPDFFSIVLSNTLIMAGTLALLIGLERYAGRVTSQLHNILLVAAFLAVQIYFTYSQPDLLARNLNISLGLLLLSAQVAWLMLRRVDESLRLAARATGVIFCAYALSSAARIVVDLSQPAPTSLWGSGIYDILFILASQMLFVALTFALLLMRNLRLVGVLESDIAQHKRLEGELRTLSILDPLTGLYNRLFFEEQAARLEQARRFPVSVLVVDVDALKQVNDRDGHAAGDSLIERVAEVLRLAFRSDDIVARIGGDEFAVLLPNTDLTGAELAVKRVRKSLERHNATHPGNPVRLSLGVSTAGRGELLSAVFRRADERMYRDKRLGQRVA